MKEVCWYESNPLLVTKPRGYEQGRRRGTLHLEHQDRFLFRGKDITHTLPRAMIVHIDTSIAKKLHGVSAVTAQDLPERFFGVAVADQPVLAKSCLLCSNR